MAVSRVLIIHNEAQYFAGAERVLQYFLSGARAPLELAVAAPEGSKTLETVPAHWRRFPICRDDRHFSIGKLGKQARCLVRFRREFPYDAVHGWAGRDWELTSLVGALAGVPAVGTLHDHPRAGFLSASRQWLMGCSARFGLDRIACVSDAVRGACVAAGYPASKLDVVHNGLLPEHFLSRLHAPNGPECPFRMGFLGAFSERKGLRILFETVSELDRRTQQPWELVLAGGTQDAAGETMMADIKIRYSEHPWWNRVQWAGWIEDPGQFLSSLDLLICPSPEFDPFPTVLLEAGAAGTAALAANVGGVAEIVEDSSTGWLFESGDWKQAAGIIARTLKQRQLVSEVGVKALERVKTEFTIDKMVSNYRKLYSNLARHG